MQLGMPIVGPSTPTCGRQRIRKRLSPPGVIDTPSTFALPCLDRHPVRYPLARQPLSGYPRTSSAQYLVTTRWTTGMRICVGPETMMNSKSKSDPLHKTPADLSEALGSEATTQAAWKDLTPLARNEWICWVISAKQGATRSRRIQRAVEELQAGKRRPCCWPGCPHRRPSAKKWFGRRAR
jgi:Bacteriocin-protection, YdeI or OmpD-Associated